MTRNVSTTEAKARFSELVAKVAHGGERIIIEKHGKPVAMLVPVKEAEAVEAAQRAPSSRRGALALLDVEHDLTNEEIDLLIRHIYETREQDKGRPVELDL